MDYQTDTENATKRFATHGEYIVRQAVSNSISVLREYDNVKGSLREIAEMVGFEYDENWTTRQFGKAVVREYGDGKTAAIGQYFVQVLDSGSIYTHKLYDNTKEGLRTISQEAGFEYDENWNTRTFGAKLIDFLS